jgi:uncharacterized protein YbjT (DUF2867 family)
MIKRNNIISIIGGSGFLGSYIIKELAKTGALIKVISRNPKRCEELKTAGYVGQISFVACDAINIESLNNALIGSDYVINLVGILFEEHNRHFNQAHCEVAQNVAQICNELRVKRLVHISALGVNKAFESKYAKTKLQSDECIRQNFPHAVILRPSVMFGPEDNFINQFACMAKFSPILPLLYHGKTKLQPVYVDDVAKAVLKVLQDDKFNGKTLELAGPTVYSLKEIIRIILRTIKRKRIITNLSNSVASIIATISQFLPKPIITHDQIKLLRYDNVLSNDNDLKALGIEPTSLEPIIRKYLV